MEDNSKYLNKEWYLPQFGKVSDRAGFPQSLANLEALIKKGHLKPNYPVLKAGHHVKRAYDYSELRQSFETFFPDLDDSLIDYTEVPSTVIEELEELSRKVDKIIEPVALPNSKSSNLMEIPQLEEDTSATDDPEYAKKNSSVFSLDIHTQTTERMSLDTPTPSSDTFDKEWWLPDLPEFEGRHKYPQSIVNLSILIRKGILQPYHYIRRLDGDPRLAGRFPQLESRFAEMLPDFDPTRIKPRYNVEDPASGWTKELLAMSRTIKKGRWTLPFYHGKDKNLFFKATMLGLIAGTLVCIPFSTLFIMFNFDKAFESTLFYKDSLFFPILFNFVFHSAYGIVIGNLVAFFYHQRLMYPWPFNWSILIGIVVFFVLGTATDTLLLLPDLGRPQVYALLIFSGLKMVAGALTGATLVLLDRVIYNTSAEYNYQAKLNNAEKIFLPVLLGILILSFASQMKFSINSQAYAAIFHLTDPDEIIQEDEVYKPLSVYNLTGYFDSLNNRPNVFVLAGTVKNNTKRWNSNWFLTASLLDEKGNVLARLGLYNGIQVKMVFERGFWSMGFLNQEQWHTIEKKENFLKALETREFKFEFVDPPKKFTRFTVTVGRPVDGGVEETQTLQE